MKPDLDPAEIDALLARNDQLARDTEALLDDFDQELIPTPLDAVIAGAVVIVGCGIAVAAVIAVIRIFGG